MTQSTIAPESFQATMKEKNTVARDDFSSLVCVSVHEGAANALGEGVFQALASHCNLKEPYPGKKEIRQLAIGLSMTT